jgi:hypothetical protein
MRARALLYMLLVFLGAGLALQSVPARADQAPEALTGGVTGVDGSQVVLHGTVNVLNTPQEACEFEYATEAEYETGKAYGAHIACAFLPQYFESTVAVEAPLGGLQPGTLYHYRLHAVNRDGESGYGADATIRLPSTVLTTAEATVRATSVTLNGFVNPGGVLVTGCEFEYGLVAEYEASVPCSSAPGGGKGTVAVNATVAGLQKGRLYHFRLRSESGGGNAEGQDATFVTPPAVVGSVLVSNVTSFAATLTGAIEPGPELFTPYYHFAYGSSAAYSLDAPSSDASAAASHQGTVTQTLTGLQPATTYHVQLVASNAGGGVVTGPDETFTTRPLVPPAVLTGEVLAATPAAATLSGSLNPEGLPTSYYFEYGSTASYGLRWPAVQVFAGTSSENENVAVEVPALAPAAIYHYRLVATNEDGTTYGADQLLSTPAYTSAAIQETPVLKTPLGIDPEAKSPAKAKGKAKTKTRKKHKPRRRKAARRG